MERYVPLMPCQTLEDVVSIEPTWYKGMYGCRQDMYGASVVVPLIAKLEADRDAALVSLIEVRDWFTGSPDSNSYEDLRMILYRAAV